MSLRKRSFALVLLCSLLVAAGAPAAEGVVNINTAAESQLQLLPRVGPSLAKKIVEYRQANGEFKTPEELVLVPGVGERTFELMAPYVAVKGETTLGSKAKGEPKSEAKPEAPTPRKEGG